jgi:hypothetical protein
MAVNERGQAFLAAEGVFCSQKPLLVGHIDDA